MTNGALKPRELRNIAEGLRDISAQLSDFLENPEYSEIDPDAVNARLDLLDRLMLKYGGSEQALTDYLQNAREELESLRFSDECERELGRFA